MSSQIPWIVCGRLPVCVWSGGGGGGGGGGGSDLVLMSDLCR